MPFSIVPWFERVGRASLLRSGHRTRHVPTPVGPIHVYDARGHGPLPPVVMLHGIGSSAASFAPILKRLQRRTRRVLAVEYPGHGSSGAPSRPLTPDALFAAVTHALDDLLEEPAVLFGNSLGGAVALHYAIARTPRVRGLFLVSPAGARISQAEMQALVDSFALRTRRDALQFLARVYHQVPRFGSLLAHELIAVLGQPAVRELLSSASVEHAPRAEDLRALPMPILFVWGRSERLFPDTALEYFRKNLPTRATIERPEGCGHSPHLEQPRQLVERIDRFLRELPRT